MLTSRRQLVALLAYWGIEQNPYGLLPDDFVSVLFQFEMNLSKRWDNDPHKLGFMDFSRDSLNDLLRSTLLAIPEFKDWNLSAKEKAAGVNLNDDRRAAVFVTRCGGPSPENDYIDLDALIRNICNSVERDQVE